jgi:hypothetical protein
LLPGSKTQNDTFQKRQSAKKQPIAKTYKESRPSTSKPSNVGGPSSIHSKAQVGISGKKAVDIKRKPSQSTIMLQQ